MRPTPIPDAEVWEGAERKVFAAPNGDLTDDQIRPVEALVDRSPTTGGLTMSARCELDPGDLEKLLAGGTVWVTFWGAMVPWAVTVVDPIALEADTLDLGDAERVAAYPQVLAAFKREHGWRREAEARFTTTHRRLFALETALRALADEWKSRAGNPAWTVGSRDAWGAACLRLRALLPEDVTEEGDQA